MLIVASALMLMLQAAPADMGKARTAFSGCLSAFLQDSLDRKMPIDDYKAALRPKCAEKEALFRAAVLAADKSYGMSAKESQADADDQVKEYLDKFAADYEDYMNNGNKPPA